MINLEKKTDIIILGSALNFILANILILLFINLFILWVIIFLGVETLLLSEKHLNPLLIKYLARAAPQAPISAPETPHLLSDIPSEPAAESPAMNAAVPPPENIIPEPENVAHPLAGEIPRPILPPNALFLSGNLSRTLETAPESSPEAAVSNFPNEKLLVRPYREPKPREITAPLSLPTTPNLAEEITVKATYAISDAEKIPRPLASGYERKNPEIAPILPIEEEPLIEELTNAPLTDIEESININSEQLNVREIKKVPRRIKHRGIRLKSPSSQS